MSELRVPDWPCQVVRGLARERGLRVWLVGGAVRDLILQRPVHDWDFAVDQAALPLARAVADAFGGIYFALDLERETGRVIATDQGGSDVMLDFALLRGPDLESDLKGRDFTINALAVDERGGLVDPTGGAADLAERRIRTTSERAFRDDPVRLLRAVRFEHELAYEMAPGVATQIELEATRLNLAAPERLREELMRLARLPRASGWLDRLDGLGLLNELMPELPQTKGVLQSFPHRQDVWGHTLATAATLDSILGVITGPGESGSHWGDIPDTVWSALSAALDPFRQELKAHLSAEIGFGHERAVLLRLGGLLHDIGKPATQSSDTEGRIHFYRHEAEGARLAAARLQALRFSRAEVELLRCMVAGHLRPAQLAQGGEVTRRAVYRYFRALGDVGVDVILLGLADHLATWGQALDERRWAGQLEVARYLLSHFFIRREEAVAPPPLISGRDLMAAYGLSPGPQIGRLLEIVREAQAAGDVRTREEALTLAGQALVTLTNSAG